MTNMPIAPPPGVCLSDSPYAVGKDVAYVGSGGSSFRQGSGRYTDATSVEFIAGFPQKIAGWAQSTATLTEGIPRFQKIWRDGSGNINIGIGTTTHLYYQRGSVLTDITPLMTIETGTLSNPVTTTNGSQFVAIADSSQNLVNGDWVFLSAASAIGGVSLDGWYQVSSRTGSGYDITQPVPATSSAGPGGGSTTFKYPRVVLTNPFTTTMGSAIVEVHHVASGASAGQFVIYAGASAVGGITLNGEYQIQSIIDADHYMITAASQATSGATGGGTVSVIYEIVVPQTQSGTNIGYGVGNYGVGAYGAGTPESVYLANGWTLDAYGYQLLAAPIGGTIYVFDPSAGGRAYPLLNAPASVLAIFVTPERFVVALGINGNPLEMAWCDQNDYTDWTTTPTNTANSGRTLIGGSYFVGGIGVQSGVSLIFTDRCCFQMNYIGAQEVYATPQIGSNCGLVSPMGVCVEGGLAYWWSDQDLWSWNGAVAVLPTDDVRASIFQANLGWLNRAYINKCAAVLNRAKRQVRFWGPGGANMENSQGVIYQYDQQCWSLMAFGKTCGQDAELLQTPISADVTGALYVDETGSDANGAALAYNLQLSDMDVANGDRNADIFGFTPDFEYLTNGAQLNVQTGLTPGQGLMASGNFPVSLSSGQGQIDLREEGKLFSFSISADALGATFRLGVCRLEVQQAGFRRAGANG